MVVVMIMVVAIMVVVVTIPVMAPVMVIAVPIPAVLIRDLVAPLVAATEVVPRLARNTRTPIIPVATHIRSHAVIQIVASRLQSGLESLALKIIELLRRLLPAQLEADLCMRHWNRQRTHGHPHG